MTLSDEEQKTKKIANRKKYNARPDVIAKRKAYNSTPERKAERREYQKNLQ